MVVGGTSANGNRGIRGVSNIGMTSGKWYCEHVITGGATARSNIGVVNNLDYGADDGSGNYWIGSGANDYIVWSHTGNAYVGSGSSNSYGVSWGVGDIIGCAFDADEGKMYIYKNGTVMNSGTPSHTGLTNGPYFFIFTEVASNISVNFGQRAFHTAAPAGYKSLNTANLPTPTIADGSKYFDTKLYTGNDGTQTISNFNFAPDWVWIKSRSSAAAHCTADIVVGANKHLLPNEAAAEATGLVPAFTSDGFTVNNLRNGADNGTTNDNNLSYVSWAWDAGTSTVTNNDGSIASQVRASAASGFSIVSWTGTGANGTIGHGLGAQPEFIIIKNRSSSLDWLVGHVGITLGSGRLLLNSNDPNSNAGASSYWNNTAGTSSVFSLGSHPVPNKSGDNIIAYCISPVAGHSAVGSYTGNGSTDGVFVHTGFKVAFLLTKRTDTSENWEIRDIRRNPFNRTNRTLFPHSSGAEDNGSVDFDFLSNGFKLRNVNGSTNANGGTYIYYAVAANPFQANGGLAR